MRIALLLLTLTACSAPFRSTIAISEAELQQKVQKRFPVEKRVLVAKLALENPSVRLEAGNDRVFLDLDASASVGPLARYPGHVSVSGKLAYDDEMKALFLDDAIVHRVDIPDLPAEFHDPVREAATVALRAHLATTPVHRIKGGTAKMFVKDVKVEDKRVLVEVGI